MCKIFQNSRNKNNTERVKLDIFFIVFFIFIVHPLTFVQVLRLSLEIIIGKHLRGALLTKHSERYEEVLLTQAVAPRTSPCRRKN